MVVCCCYITISPNPYEIAIFNTIINTTAVLKHCWLSLAILPVSILDQIMVKRLKVVRNGRMYGEHDMAVRRKSGPNSLLWDDVCPADY
uniref:Uncharacterized protein n=1 Tax=Octopus bimaculoides TaxID=37653 RepID=A0A0L8HKA8_OCTBM